MVMIFMVNVRNVVIVYLFSCALACADYFCIENRTNTPFDFTLIDGHYDVYEYQFLPIEGGLGNRRPLKMDEKLCLKPKQKIMLRTVYSYIKSGGRSSLTLLNNGDSIVFSTDSFDDFKLSYCLNVKVFSQQDVLDDNFSGLADKVYIIEECESLS